MFLKFILYLTKFKNKRFLVLTLLLVNILLPSSIVNAANCGRDDAWYPSSATTDAPVSQSTISISSNSNQLVQAIKGTDGKLYSRIASTIPQGPTNWNEWIEGNGITVKSEPELVEFKDASTNYLLVSAFGTDNGLYVRKLYIGNDYVASWTNWNRGGSITLKSIPVTSYLSTGAFASKPIILQSGFGTDNCLYTRTSTDGEIWTSWNRGGNITLASKPEQVLLEDKLIQFARGTDNGLYSRYTLDGLNWTSLLRNSGDITVLDETSTVYHDFKMTNLKKLQQAVRGTDKGVYFRSSSNGIDWSEWVRLGSITALEKPSLKNYLVCQIFYEMNLYVLGTDNKLYEFENKVNDTPSFGLDLGFKWIPESNNTYAGNVSQNTFLELIGTPGVRSYAPEGTVQAIRGNDNKVYTRLSNWFITIFN